jgi:hypothetical protein
MNEIAVPNGALLSFIERAAKDESFDVAKFETLLRVRRDEAHDHSRRVFNAAMAACQSEMQPVLRESTNPGVRSKYAKLEAIDQQMRPIYTRHGFSVRFGSAPPPQPGWMRITCTVAHESGYFEENYLDSPVSTQGSQGGRIAMTPVQAVGSVVTYLRRYLLGMVFNIVQADVVGEDDDGETMREQPRAAAAPMPRGARVAERAPAYEAPAPKPHPLMPNSPVDPNPVDAASRPERTDAQWKTWIDKLRAACEVLYHRSEVVEVAERPSVADALANGPEWVRREISAILAESYKRFAIEAEPTEEELPEVQIEGQDKVLAGD